MKMMVMATVTMIRLICSLCCRKDRLLSTKFCASGGPWKALLGFVTKRFRWGAKQDICVVSSKHHASSKSSQGQ